ncbi:MAG: hypothetical protein J6D03_09335 [Clostridia bacterium]|nr:hypothetical protein [Clostridia bacterium]
MVVMITSEEYKELVIKANKYDELQKPKLCAAEEKKDADVEISVKKITPEEMGDILEDLKNKIIGGK